MAGMIDFLSPNSFSSISSISKSKTTDSDSTKFSDLLDQAHCDFPIEQPINNLDSSNTSLLSSAFDIGLAATTGNPLLTGFSALSLLQGVMNKDVNAQLTELGSDIAKNLFAGLAGDDSATALTTSSVMSVVADKSGVVSEVGSGVFSTVEKTVDKVTDHVTSKADGVSFIKGTIPWDISHIRLKDILDNEKN